MVDGSETLPQELVLANRSLGEGGREGMELTEGTEGGREGGREGMEGTEGGREGGREGGKRDGGREEKKGGTFPVKDKSAVT